jgi:penicillin-insensitive murein DD-endopeptidase
VHSLQRRSGADRESVRLSDRRSRAVLVAPAVSVFVSVSVLRSQLLPRLSLILGVALGVSGCGWVFAEDGTSASLGTHADGALRAPVMLPMGGDGYTVPSHWRPRNSNFGTEELVGLLVRSARAVDEQLPGGVVAIGDLSRRGGGASIEHKSHRSGRDADIFYYALDEAGRPAAPGEAMLRFNAEGRAIRWSPARGEKPPNRSVPRYHFDTKRNWALVRALIVDPGTEVQWIFIQHNLAALLFREAVASGDDPAVLARAAYVLREPSDAEPHDDHMHIRVYCDARDRVYGCVDKGPVRWLKKGWKYMAPPLGRAPLRPDDTAWSLLRAMTGELPALFFGAPLTT